MNKITVIGSGTMGNGIAHVFAQNGFSVSLMDLNIDQLKKATGIIEKNLERQVNKGILTGTEKQNALENIRIFDNLEKAAEGADLVIEAATENLLTKLDIFRRLDEICPENTILASNTSSISITKIGAGTNRPDMVIGMHFMNPVPIMKLVEIIRGYSTSDETANAIIETSLLLKKFPVIVEDYPGFVANRILMPMINEAIYTLFEGISGVSEIDNVMKLGMSHPMGPLQLADFIGLDVCLSILKVLQDGFGNPKFAPCPLLINMVEAGFTGFKSGEGFYVYTEGNKEPQVSNRFNN